MAIKKALVIYGGSIEELHAEDTLGGGDVAGPSASTDNAIARFDGTTGKLIQDSSVTIDNDGNMIGVTIDSFGNLVGADHIHYKIKANETITKGNVLKFAGYNAGENAVEVVKISSASDVAIGISHDNLSTGEFGLAVVQGITEGFDTSAFTAGTILYPNTSGGLTATAPTSGTYQACAFVLRSQSENGALLVSFISPDYVTSSANTANTVVLRNSSGNFSAGTITAELNGNAATVTNGLYTTDLGVSVQAYDADIPTVSASQVEMETGTESALRSMSPLRVAQAIAALGGGGGGGFDAGTVMLFVQTAAPTGWTKSTTHDNKALRVVSGTVSSGGSVAFTTAFASQTPTGTIDGSFTVGATTLSTAQMPSHNHTLTAGSYSGNIGAQNPVNGVGTGNSTRSTNNTGSGGSHTHSISGSPAFTGNAINLAVQYVDAIIAVKD